MRGYRGNLYYDDKKIICEDDIYYKSGDVVTLSRIYPNGAISGGAKVLGFTLTLPKRIKSGLTPTIQSGTISVRHAAGGYLLQGANIKENTTFNYAFLDNLLTIQISYETAFNTTNNTPISLDLLNLKIAFS